MRSSTSGSIARASNTRKGRYYCGHCEEKISKTLYFRHKRLYYNPDSEEWISSKETQVDNNDMVVDFTFHDDDVETGK